MDRAVCERRRSRRMADARPVTVAVADRVIIGFFECFLARRARVMGDRPRVPWCRRVHIWRPSTVICVSARRVPGAVIGRSNRFVASDWLLKEYRG